jgi:hypothetical protein
MAGIQLGDVIGFSIVAVVSAAAMYLALRKKAAKDG